MKASGPFLCAVLATDPLRIPAPAGSSFRATPSRQAAIFEGLP